MRIRRRPPQIPAPDPAAGGGGCSGSEGMEGKSAAGYPAGKGEIGGLHPSIEVEGKGGRPWGRGSVIWRLGQPGGGGPRGSSLSVGGGSDDACCNGEVQKRHKGKAGEGEDDRVGDAADESEKEKEKKPGDAAGGLHTIAAANGLGAESFVSATTNHGRFGGAPRKRKSRALSNGYITLARSPSSSVTTGGGIASYMHGGEEEFDDREDNTGNSKNRRRSPALLKEGSRCSRVNGRGWRCCQQTLVGYSLCEHHLGKGRLRSVSSVRCKKAGGAAGNQLPTHPVSSGQQLHDDQGRSLANLSLGAEEERDETEPSEGARRGRRVGVVKARSISSLLGQTSSVNVVDHGPVQQPFAPMIAPTATSTGSLPALTRAPIETRTPAAAAVVASLPTPTPASQQGISAVV